MNHLFILKDRTISFVLSTAPKRGLKYNYTRFVNGRWTPWVPPGEAFVDCSIRFGSYDGLWIVLVKRNEHGIAGASGLCLVHMHVRYCIILFNKSGTPIEMLSTLRLTRKNLIEVIEFMRSSSIGRGPSKSNFTPFWKTAICRSAIAARRGLEDLWVLNHTARTRKFW